MWRGLAASVVASAAAATRLASSLGSQPQECLGPTLWLTGDGGQWELPAVDIWGCQPPWVSVWQSSRLLPSAPLAPASWTEPGCHALLLSHNWSTGKLLKTWGEPCSSLSLHSLPLNSRKCKGTTEVRHGGSPGRHHAKCGPVITVTQPKPAQQL